MTPNLARNVLSAEPSRRFTRRAWLGILGSAASVFPGCSAKKTITWSTLELEGLGGERLHPAAGTPAHGHVFLFISNECPISNRYAPEIQRIHRAYAPRGFTFWIIHSDRNESRESIRRHASDYSLPPLVVCDPHHEAVRFTQATMTPEAVVLRPEGTLVYRGRIDDRYVVPGLDRPEPTRRDLVEVLSALADGRVSNTQNAPAVGCRIPGLEEPRQRGSVDRVP